MVYAIFTFIALGIAGGYFFLGLEHKDLLDEILMSALYFMVFVAGIEIGGNRHIIKKICNPQSILLAVAIPTAVTIGSLGGAALSAFVIGMEMRDALLVGSALGWYSLSSVVISTLYSVEIGTIAFLANMLREVLAFLAIPLLVKINKFLALAPSGAATMDSGLPVVIKYTNIHVGLFAFINGLLLTLLFRCRCGGFDVFFGLRFGLGNVQAFHTAPVGIGFDLGGRCLREDVLLHGVGLRERTGSNDSILRGAIIGCQRGRCHPGESKSGRGERSNHGTMLNMLHRILSLQHPSYKKRGTVVGRETQ